MADKGRGVAETYEIADPELVKLVARLQAESLDDARKRLLDDNSSMSRWLLASLLVVNGGGALAALDAAGENASWQIAGLCFVAGVACSLLSGVVHQWALKAGVATFAEVHGYWAAVETSGEHFSEMDIKHEAALRSLEVKSQLSSVPGWLAGILFVSGAIMLGVGV